MQLFESLNQNPNLSLALGFFDGLHLGHQAVIESAVDFARENNTKSAVITFKNHPSCCFKNVREEYILSFDDKIDKISALGVDFLYVLNFDETMANINAQDYLSKILVNNFSPKSISTGFNHRFGKDCGGTSAFLRQNQTDFGYKYLEIPAQKLKNEIISSSLIREKIMQGDTETAGEMLGSPFSIVSKVVSGKHFGEKLGFKTANFVYPEHLVKIPKGVYAVRVAQRPAIANFGVHPSVNETAEPILEVHIPNFDRDIYGKTLRIEFVKKLRDEKKFSTTKALKAQIAKDIACLGL